MESLKASPGDTVHVGDVIMELNTGEVEENSGEEVQEGAGEQEETGSEDESELEDNSESSGNPVIEDVPVSDSTETSQDSSEPQDSSSNSSEKTVSTNPESSRDVLALPKVRKLAEEKGVDLASIKTGERITENEVLEAAEGGSSEKSSGSPKRSDNSQDVDATPAVRKLAREKGIDITDVDGSGKGGKVTRQDVLNYEEPDDEQGKEPEKSEHEEKTEEHPVHSDREVEKIEMSGIKKKTAERMSESYSTAPHVTHVEKADVTELQELREEEKEEVDPHLTYLPFIMKALADSLKEYPALNAEIDMENDEIIEKKYYDFNIAVDTENGLLIPKIKNVDRKSIVELASEIGEKAEKAKNRELSPKELENGTFSITNLGVIGGEEFTPIINYPQTAILGIGSIGETAEVVDGKVVPRTTVKLSLSYDHRAVDGATAARFMNELVEKLENPERMLLEL